MIKERYRIYSNERRNAFKNFHASMRRSSFDGGVYLKVVRDIFRIKRPELMPFLL